MSSRIPAIQEFPNDDQIWRVDFFGGIQRNPSIPDEPTVQIIVSPLADPTKKAPKELAGVDAVIDTARRTIDIGVGQLPYVKIGSLWRNGECLSYSAGKEESLQVVIRANTTQLLKANRIVDGDVLVRPRFHRVGAGHDAFCLAVEYAGDPYGLIIPAMEVLRFYYSVSTSLAGVVFSNDFLQMLNKITDLQYSCFDISESKLFLRLQKSLCDVECWIIGRMLLAKEASKCLKFLGESLISQSSRGNSILYPPAAFPFLGETDLTVRYKSVRAPKGKWRYLVFSIEQCTAPFPLERLVLDRAFINPNTEGVSAEELHLQPDYPLQQPTSPVKNSKLQSAKEPSKELKATVYPTISDSFPFLKDKVVEKMTKVHADTVAMLRTTRQHGLLVDFYSTGGGGYEKDNTVAPAEIVPQQPRKSLPANIENFRDMVECLNKFSGITAFIRENAVKTAYLPIARGTNRKWSYFDYKRSLHRMVEIGDVQIRGRWWCLVEFQHTEKDHCNLGILNRANGQKIDDDALHHILCGLAEVRGVWKNIKSPYRAGILINYIKHASETHEEFARAVLRKLI